MNDFAEADLAFDPNTKNPVRDTKYEVQSTKYGVSEANPQTRETPRERLPKRSPSRDSLSYRNSKIPKDPVSR